MKDASPSAPTLKTSPYSSLTTISKGYLICLVGTILWSSTAIFIRHLTVTYQMPPITLAVWRDLLAATILFLVFSVLSPRLRKPDFRQFPFYVFYGFVLALFNAFWTVSVALNGAAVSTVLAYSSAGFTAVLGRWLYAEQLDWLKSLAVVFSLGGCVLVAGAYNLGAWSINLIGVSAGLLSGIGFTAYSLVGKAVSGRGINPWTALIYSFLFAGLFLFGFNHLPWVLSEGLGTNQMLWLGDSMDGWLFLVILAAVPTLGGYGLYTISLGYLPASVANLIATLEPILTAALAYIFLEERTTSVQLVGGGMIVLGVILLRLRDRFHQVGK